MSDFPVFEDLSIAFQTMRHQIEELSLSKSTNNNRRAFATVESEERVTNLSTAELFFEGTRMCTTHAGRLKIRVFNKKTQKSEEFWGEFIGEKQLKVYRVGDGLEFLLYDLQNVCPSLQ